MSNSIAIGYNTGSTVDGTTQVGNLSIQETSQEYSLSPNGVRFWGSPDLDEGYVIARQVPSGDQPNQLSIPAYVGFWGTKPLKTEQSFINLSEYVSRFAGSPQTFTSGGDAKIWLNNNGYWTSYGILPPVTPTVTPTPSSTPIPATVTIYSKYQRSITGNTTSIQYSIDSPSGPFTGLGDVASTTCTNMGNISVNIGSTLKIRMIDNDSLGTITFGATDNSTTCPNFGALCEFSVVITGNRNIAFGINVFADGSYQPC